MINSAVKLRTRLSFEDIAGPDEAARLLEDAQTVTYEAREVIFREGDEGRDLYVILEGRVEFYLSRGHGANDIYLDEQHAGEYFGELGLLDAQPRSASAMARVRTTCKLISQQRFLSWLVENPQCAIALLRHASVRIRDLSEDLRASMSSAYERVARFVQQVAVEDKQLGCPVVHVMPAVAQLARMLGISRERTSQILNELTRGGYVEPRGRSLLVKRPLPDAY
jgi:CRP/FNR family transcriptional regulator, cyclic AMP receptor protein